MASGIPSSGRSREGEQRLVGQHLRDDRQVVVGAKRHLAGEALVEQHAQRPDVGAVIEVLVAARLLGRHVEGRAEQEPGVGQAIGLGAVVAPRLDRLGDPEVDDLHEVGVAAPHEVEVLGLHVAVEDPLGVRGAERAGRLPRDAQAALDRQRRLAHRSSSASDSPSRNSMTTNERPSSVVPKSVTSTMFSWPMELARRASCSRRATKSLLAWNFSSSTFTATRLPMSVCLRLVHRAHPPLADPAHHLVAASQHRPDERVELLLGLLRLGRGQGGRPGQRC